MEVGDDTIVNNHEFSLWIRSMRVTVLHSGLTMSSPSCVSDTHVVVKHGLTVDFLTFNLIFQNLDLTRNLDNEGLIFAVAINSNSTGVVTSVFQTLETINEVIDNFATGFIDEEVNVAKNSTVVSINDDTLQELAR